MSLTMRMPRPLVVLLGAAYLFSSMGCAAGRLRPLPGAPSSQPHAAQAPAAQAAPQAMVRRLPQVEGEQAVQQAWFQSSQASPCAPAGGGPLWDVAIDSRPCYEDNEAVGSPVVRANHDPYNGPVRDFLISPYGIGLMVAAAIVLPLALDPRERPVGQTGGGGGGGGP